MRAFNATETIELGGEEYRLYIDVAVIDAIEDEIGGAFTDFMMGLGKGSVRAGKMTKAFRGLLATHHPELSLNEVGALYFDHGREMIEGLERLCIKAWPEQAKDVKGANPRKARRGTGVNS